MNILTLKLKSKSNSNVFIAETDGGEFLLHSDIIVKMGIKQGCVNDEEFFVAVEESKKLIAMNVATKYLNSNIKTEKQLKDYLYKKEFDSNTIQFVVDKLKEYKIIDDETYSEMYIKSNPTFSANKLKQKLMLAGVKPDIVSNFLEAKDDEESCLTHAHKFLRNKQIESKIIEKLIRNLQGKGFRWETIKSVLNQLKLEIDN